MIISHILGGLGNQMFQYAAGRAISYKHHKIFLLDLTDFNEYHLHQGYILDKIFDIEAKVAQTEDLKYILKWRYNKYVKKVLKRSFLSKYRGKNLIFEPHFNYWSGINNINDDAYLYGYWQSEKYFLDIESIIRKDFTFKDLQDSNNIIYQLKMASCNSVSIHIRRGDYTNNLNKKIFHSCSVDYYKKAVIYLTNRIVNPVFFIFSDDLQWVKDNIDISYPHVYIDQNKGEQSYIDMQLMSCCKHHIIANSSFSWWAAWLNTNPEKIVVSPKNWFNNGFSDLDLIPCQWIRL